jgi:hypothetical protein
MARNRGGALDELYLNSKPQRSSGWPASPRAYHHQQQERHFAAGDCLEARG